MSHNAPAELIERVRAKLCLAFAPSDFHISDDSPKHAGHPGAKEGFHLTVRLVSDRFEGLGAMQRHRLVYAALSEEMAGPLHALRVQASAPSELPSKR